MTRESPIQACQASMIDLIGSALLSAKFQTHAELEMNATVLEERREGKHVLIVGAGCFGLSTACHLLRSNQPFPNLESTPNSYRYNVTVIDAASTLPAPDASSSDLNEFVRSGYSGPFYPRLARETIKP